MAVGQEFESQLILTLVPKKCIDSFTDKLTETARCKCHRSLEITYKKDVPCHSRFDTLVTKNSHCSMHVLELRVNLNLPFGHTWIWRRLHISWKRQKQNITNNQFHMWLWFLKNGGYNILEMGVCMLKSFRWTICLLPFFSVALLLYFNTLLQNSET